jgi:hypothetical protein
MISYEKEIWNLFATKTRDLLQEEYTNENMRVVIEYMKNLDTYMKKYYHHEEWQNENTEYETLHERYAQYRWRNNV